MKATWPPLVASWLVIAGCEQASDTREESTSTTETERESVFDPLTETIDRAESVEDTLREDSEELRRRIEEAEQ